MAAAKKPRRKKAKPKVSINPETLAVIKEISEDIDRIQQMLGQPKPTKLGQS